MIHGFPVALGAIAGVLAVLAWAYGKAHRFIAWMFGICAFMLAVGITPWTDALAALTGSGTGLTVLAGVIIASGLMVWYEVIRKHRHHRIRTPVVAAVFGTALVLTIGRLSELTASAVKTGPKSASALAAAVAQIHSGKAAAGVPRGHHPYTILLLALGIVTALIVAAVNAERRRKPVKDAGRKGRQVPAAKGRRAVTSGRGK